MDNRICYLCGQKYSYCPNCNEDVYKPSWYAMWCSENCKEIDNILAAHTVGQISISEAKEMLVNLNLDFNTVDMLEDSRKHLNQILNHGNKDLKSCVENHKEKPSLEKVSSNKNLKKNKSKKNKK